jgi:hypothetical protein
VIAYWIATSQVRTMTLLTGSPRAKRSRLPATLLRRRSAVPSVEAEQYGVIRTPSLFGVRANSRICDFWGAVLGDAAPATAWQIVIHDGPGACAYATPNSTARSLRNVSASLLNRSISDPTAAASAESDASRPSVRNSCLRCCSVSEETFPIRRSRWSSTMNCPAVPIL